MVPAVEKTFDVVEADGRDVVVPVAEVSIGEVHVTDDKGNSTTLIVPQALFAT